MKSTKFTQRQIERLFDQYAFCWKGIPIDKAKEIFGSDVVSKMESMKKQKPKLTPDELLALMRTDEYFSEIIENEKWKSFMFRFKIENRIETNAALWRSNGRKWLLANDNGQNIYRDKSGIYLTYTGTIRAAEHFNYLLKKK